MTILCSAKHNMVQEKPAFQSLIELLLSIPSLGSAQFGVAPDSSWWVKFSIDIDHPFAWNVVQELGHVLNYLSADEKLSLSFTPVAAQPFRIGGPREFLLWIIECKNPNFSPAQCSEWLRERLPRPVEDPTQWSAEEMDDELEEDEPGLLT